MCCLKCFSDYCLFLFVVQHKHALAVQAVVGLESATEVYQKQLTQYQAEAVTIEQEKKAAELKEAELRDQKSYVCSFAGLAGFDLRFCV